jgi:hypothetical protein
MSVEDPAVYDHFRPVGDGETDDDGPVYRVVGVVDDDATLLRVTDAEGSREATGDLRHVPVDRLSREYAAATNPDSGWEPIEYLAALFVVGGVALVAHPDFEVLSGVILAAAGVYTLWRHGKLPLPV